MPIDITINDISGQTPFDIYVCNTGQTYCVYSATITSGYHTVTWGLIYFNAAFTTSACRFITTSPSEVDVDNQIVCATFIR